MASAQKLTPHQQVTAMVAAAIYANLAREIFEQTNGWTRDRIVAEAREVAELVVGAQS
jgi:hypothetical protein